MARLVSSKLVATKEGFYPKRMGVLVLHAWNAAVISPFLLLPSRGSQYSVGTLIEVGLRITKVALITSHYFQRRVASLSHALYCILPLDISHFPYTNLTFGAYLLISV